MNYGEIKKTDIANGIGVRVSLFVSGCRHHCKNCFNSETWDFGYGKEYTSETEREIIEALSKGYISGLSVLGGEPFEPENQETILGLIKKAKEMFTEKSVWCYTGFTFEELTGESRGNCSFTNELLSLIDVLVDGKFIEEKKDITLVFRGSSNQSIIDVKKTLDENKIVLWEE